MSTLLFLLGIALSVAGLVSGIFTSQWTLIALILLFVGIVFFLISLGLKLSKRTNFKGKITKIDITSLLRAIAVLTILVLINFLAIRHPVRFDLTENRIFTLSSRSQAIAADLQQPLKVWIFTSNIDPETQTLLQNYQSYGNNFSYQLVNPEKEIELAQKFQIQSLGEVYLEYGTKKQQLNIPATPLEINISESQLANAIAKIQQDRTTSIYFLQGHGEPALNAIEGGFSRAIAELTARGYVVEGFDLATSPQIPKNANLIAIAKPLKPLLDSEVTRLQQYLQEGGNLLVMLLPNTDVGLQSLWQNWGVKLDNRLMIDGSAIGERLPTIVMADRYGNHPITRTFDNGISLFPESRRIDITEKADITATPLVIANDSTWAENNLAEETITFNPQEDIPSPLNLAIALSRKSSRMVVFGNGNFATNGWFNQQLNGDLFLNAIDWLTGVNEDIIAIEPKELVDRRINLTPLQAGMISWLAIRIFPLLSLAIASSVWWRKR